MLSEGQGDRAGTLGLTGVGEGGTQKPEGGRDSERAPGSCRVRASQEQGRVCLLPETPLTQEGTGRRAGRLLLQERAVKDMLVVTLG